MADKKQDYVVTHAGIMNLKGERLKVGQRVSLNDKQAKAYVNKVRLASLGPTPDEKDAKIAKLEAALEAATAKDGKKAGKASEKAKADADKKAKAKAKADADADKKAKATGLPE